MAGSFHNHSGLGDSILWVIAAVIALLILFIPSIIAFYRGHHYRWVIFVLNLTGIGWIPSFIWAIWPRRTHLLGVVLNDPVSNSIDASAGIYHQFGNNINAFGRGYSSTKDASSFGNSNADGFGQNQSYDYMITIGRNLSCDVVISDSSVSRLHARLYVYGDKSMVLEDANSTYGIFRRDSNGEKTRIYKSTVNKNDIIFMGQAQILIGEILR
jgi:hypothetical protein